MIITPGSQLRAQYIPSPSIREDHSVLKYIAMLQEKGLQIHPHLFPSIFELKNKLEYPGIATTKSINSDQILVKVPQSLVLSSIRAIQEPQLKQIYKDIFYHNEDTWEDRVITTYLLYIYHTKQTDNIWYQMLLHMSKDIDVLCFWPEQELNLFRDLTVKSAAIFDLESFENQWKQFSECAERNPLLQGQSYSKENYRWVYIHMSSRCFGKTLDYISMVPFCELFNHHTTDVCYLTQNAKTKQKEKQIYDLNDDNTSNGSDESEDYLQEGEFDYQSLDNQNFTWSCKQCLDFNENQKNMIQFLAKNLIERIKNQLSWKDFTILFVGSLIERVKVNQTQYLVGRKIFDKSYSELKKVQNNLDTYKQYIIKFYKAIKGKKYQYLPKNQQNDKPNNDKKQQQNQIKYYKYPLKKQKQFQNFILKTGPRDHFLANNQVYFSYGRISNRLLLLRYGIAIQGNKYDHVWMSFDIGGHVEAYPDVVNQMMEWGLSRRRKFKIKHHQLNQEIILFHRLNNWLYHRDSIDDIFFVIDKTRQICILDQIRNSYLEKLEMFKGNNNLEDNSIGYHQYFIRVYHLEKEKILIKQINLLTKIIQILNSILLGKTKNQALNILNPLESYILKEYINTIQ